MYCVSCGNSISPELNYCNRCGAKTGKDGAESKPINPLSYLITALCIIGGGGLLLLVGLIAILLDKTPDGRTIVLVTAAYTVSLTMIVFLIMREISKLVNMQAGTRTLEGENRFGGSLSSVNTAQLEAPRQQPIGSSVTDHTTRTLDEVMYKKR